VISYSQGGLCPQPKSAGTDSAVLGKARKIKITLFPGEFIEKKQPENSLQAKARINNLTALVKDRFNGQTA